MSAWSLSLAMLRFRHASRLLGMAFCLALVTGNSAEINPNISVQERHVGTNTQQNYFLIEHRNAGSTNSAPGLIVILPGGPGSKDFLPFCANVLTYRAVPTNFVVAELIAPQWTNDENRIVWPSKLFPDPNA